MDDERNKLELLGAKSKIRCKVCRLYHKRWISEEEKRAIYREIIAIKDLQVLIQHPYYPKTRSSS
jgi:hypothetical protein